MKKVNWVKNSARIVFYITLVLLVQNKVSSQTISFPGAEGFGQYAHGGRGGDVIEVTNLNDAGPGSLREAIKASGARTVVFRVSGNIFLQSDLKINNDSITIAGQTAPGEGITLANYPLLVSADNVIIRYIRSRLGDVYEQESDAFTCTNTKNVIVDHCTFSWSVDEAASCYLNENFTMQWCIISESLYHSVHSKGNHGYGGIWGGANASFHHNLIAHHTSRTPRFHGARWATDWPELVDFRNNVIYNWGFNSVYGGEPSELDGSSPEINMARNYYKSGPATSSGEKKYRILDPDADGVYGFGSWYIDSNFVFGFPDASNDNWTYGVQGITSDTKDAIKSVTPFNYEITTIHTAEEAFNEVLQKAGTILPRRDTHDIRISYEVANGTTTYGGVYGANSGIIDSQTEVGGWPVLFSAPAPLDSDHDGMPDEWELMMGFDPFNPNDRNGDHNGDGFTNLEEYLNTIVEQPDFVLPPTDLAGILIGVNDANLSWTGNDSNIDGYIIERKTTGNYNIIDTVSNGFTTFIDSNLLYSTTYFYKVRAYLGSDSSVTSNEVSVLTLAENGLPYPANYIAPLNETAIFELPVELSWEPGLGSTSHDLYFGTTGTPDFVGNQTETNYTANDLVPGTTYYWRVDEVNENGITQGDVWSFTVVDVIPPSLVAHYSFEDYSEAYDSSIFDNHGSAFNFTESSVVNNGPIGNALYFSGANQYMQVPSSSSLNFNINSFSIAFWMKQSKDELDGSKEYRYIIKGSNIEDAGTGKSGKRYEVYYKASTNEFTFATDDNIVKSQINADGDKFVSGKWTHVVAVRDTTTKRLYLYLNGTLTKLGSDGTKNLFQTEDMYIGFNPDYPEYLIGTLDDLRIYNYALERDEINEIYSLGFTTGLNNIKSEQEMSYRIYPVPVKNELNIQSKVQNQNSINIAVYSETGQLVLSRKQLIFDQNKISINTSDLSAGLYIIKLFNEKEVSVQRFMKVD